MRRAMGRMATISAALAAVIVALTTSVHATPIGVGGSIAFTFPAPAANSHLAADATITLLSLTSTTAVFDIVVHNTSSGDVGFTDRLTALGFRLTPTPTASSSLAVTFVSGTNAFQHADTPDAITSFNGLENVCAYVGNSCSAGNAGLTAGQTDEFRITLAGPFTGFTTLDLSSVAIKWTDCTGCSFEIAGVPRTSVPEPSTLLLLGTALLAGGAFARRRTRRQVLPEGRVTVDRS